MIRRPFEDDHAAFYVLINEEEQYSLWPASKPVPSGWTVAFGQAAKVRCVEFVEQTWTDMRPKSVREAAGRRISAAV